MPADKQTNMKNVLLLLAGLLFFSSLLADADILNPPKINTLIIGHQVVLEWARSRANYQVQARPDFDYPNWFVGVDSLNLIENGQWVTNKQVTLYSQDARPASGMSSTSADQVTVPRAVVAQFTEFPAIQNGALVPFGTFTFTRLD
jgi:hypothetical protein